ncbi:MAG: hypothetical protein WD646_15010 [Actinomycetota bacterium]
MKSPREWTKDPRIERAGRFVSRYQPFLITVIAIALIAVLLPGRSPETTDASDITSEIPDAPLEEASPDNPVAAPTTETTSAPTVAPSNPGVLGFEEAQAKGVALVANCDPKTGQIKIPTRFAPTCTQKYVAPNSGNTWQGVTKDKIVVAYYQGEGDAASEAVLTAAGANDSPEAERATVQDWFAMYQAHYNMWGRKVELHIVQPSGAATDDAAGKADAIKIATQIKAFAAIGAPNNTFVNELVARKVMCMCTVSQPIETYIKWAPYVWTTLLASTQGYIHRAQYVGGRLAGRNAKWAYDDLNPTQQFKGKKRKFGFLYYETTDFAYKAGADYFVEYMKDKYGVSMVTTAYNGYPDVAATQEQARPVIQKFKEAGVTSIICSCDPFGPIFFSGEATRQLYGPEWILTGSALTDTAFFGRLYDQDQWAHAFGVSYLPARMPENLGQYYRLHNWHFNREPTAANSYGVLAPPISIFFNGVHLAGSALTPETFRKGMYSQPILGEGGITTIAQSYGDKGLWPWKEDPVAADDTTEIWWDRNAQGEDERGVNGRGLYRFVAGGKRYLPGKWPTTEPKAFDPAGTVTIYNQPPPVDKWPCYPSPVTKKLDRC